MHLCEPTTACPAEAVRSPVSKSKLHDPSEHLAENFSEPERSKIGLERVFQLSEYPDSWVFGPGCTQSCVNTGQSAASQGRQRSTDSGLRYSILHDIYCMML
jgi:hypothetical protein